MDNIKNDHALDMSKLVNQLRVKAGVMEMGELIAWGSDITLMREAADEIERLIEDLARCRHQASCSVGDSEALKVQLKKVREIANESLSKV